MMIATLVYTDILALSVLILGVINVITLLRYRAHIYKDQESSIGIVVDTKSGKVMRSFDYDRHGLQWRNIAKEYTAKLNGKGK